MSAAKPLQPLLPVMAALMGLTQAVVRSLERRHRVAGAPLGAAGAATTGQSTAGTTGRSADGPPY